MWAMTLTNRTLPYNFFNKFKCGYSIQFYDFNSFIERFRKENFSTKIEDSNKEKKSTVKATSNRKDSLIVPNLSIEKIKELTTITGICVGVSHISWIKLSIPALSVLDWNSKALPDDFNGRKDELSILKLANDIRNSLPNADLYVMETFSIRGRELYEKINYIHLSSMLTVLLSGVLSDSSQNDKVIFQKKFVLNNLHNILIGGERISTRKLVEGILHKIPNTDHEFTSDIYTSTEINEKFLTNYKESSLAKQEDLSIVFLLALTFVDVIIRKNEKSLTKIYEKRPQKLK